MKLRVQLGIVALATGKFAGCAAATDDRCGPSEAVVARAIDGDTVELESGERVRYLLIDTPESTNGANDCYGHEAAQFNAQLVEGKTVQLEYDEVCTDKYDRLLAYIELDGRSINELLVERGYACVLHIPPNGDDRAADYEALEAAAKAGMVGMWGACEDVTCE